MNIKREINKLFLSLLLIFPFLVAPAQAKISQEPHTLGEYHFRVAPGLESRVNFWKKVYSEYTTNHAIIHDSENLDIIYEIIYFGNKKLSHRQKERKANKVKLKYKKILRKLSKSKKITRSKEEQRVANLVKKNFYRASNRIRLQIGQKDRFAEGLVRSGLYMDEIKKIFREYRLPEELTVLPHVESSFQIRAYSSAGAAGIWQFTRSTGRRFLKVKYDVDERSDPLLATRAAAKLLKQNFEKLRSWPLAITAYNHGLQGMKRAKRRHGREIVNIIKAYRSRTFGFASENFYAEFLAALEVSRNHEKYFPGLKIEKPLKTVSLKLDHYVSIKTMQKYLNMTREEISKFNPALRRPVLSGEKRIPKGFVIKAPAEKFDDLYASYKVIPASMKFRKQIRSKWYTVRRGDTLSTVAARFRTSVRKLKQINNINRRNMIYVGQVLHLPERYPRRTRLVKAVAEKPTVYESDQDTVTYKIKRYENLTVIAKKFNTEVGYLVKINRFENPDNLFPGQIVKIPKKAIVAQAVKIVEKKPEEEKKIIIAQKPTLKKKTRIAKKKGRIELEDGVKVAYAKVELPSAINQNRSAFLPVSFSSERQRKSQIGTITVDFDETLSHYADWARLSVNKIRRINKMRRNQSIQISKKIKVPFTRTTPSKFEEKRQEYHKAIQEDFFNNYRVEKTLVKKVRKGETLWEICNEIYFIPLWLLSTYNPEKDIHSLSVGETIVIPVITPIKNQDA